MSLSGIAASRRVSFLMVFILMAGAGVFGLTRLGLDYFPKADLGEIMIVVMLPGAGPEEVETLVSEVIENAVSGVEGVETVESRSRASVGVVTAVLGTGSDIDQALEDIKEAVAEVEDALPENATDPLVVALESSMKPLVIVSFTSEAMSSAELRRLIEDEVQPILSRVPGISSSSISGGEERQVNVEVDPVLLWERDMTISQVYMALAAVGADQPGGDVQGDGLEIPISLSSGFHDLDEIRRLVVGAYGGVPVRLGDIASVEDGYREQTMVTTLDGSSTILLTFRKSSDANTVNTCRALTGEVARITAAHRGEFETEIVYSQESFIRSSMNSLLDTGIEAVILTALVLVLFLGSPANAGIVSISMPLSFITTFAFMYFFGVDLNIMSLAGLSISIGRIVDDSVVVLENTHRLRKEGAGILEAAVKGAGQVGMAVTASTLTAIAVFLPMLFVRGLTGQIFRDLSITISSALLISLFVSQTLVPLMTGMSKNIVKKHRRGSPLQTVQDWIQSLEEAYARAMVWCLAHRRMTILPVTGLFVVTVILSRFIPTSFIPDVKEGTITITASTPPGTSLETTDSIASALEDSLLAAIDPADFDHSLMNVGRSSGIGAMFGSDASCRIDLTLYLRNDVDLRHSLDEYETIVRTVLGGVPGLTYGTTTGMHIGSEYPIQLAIYGTGLQDLRLKGAMVEQALGRIPGTVDCTSSLDEWVDQVEFVPDPAVMSQRGVSPALVASEVTLGVLGLDATSYYESGNDLDVHLSYSDQATCSIERVAGLPVAGAPLESWGTFETQQVPQMVLHRDRSRCVLVSCKIEGRALGDVGRDVEAMMDTLDLGGSSWELLGDIPDQKESFASMGLAILVAVALVYMVMASQFESLLEPFLLIFEIPMALIGVILVHLATGITLGITSLVGILMLVGIVVNNGIILIDFANRRRRTDGVTIEEAVVEAGRKRMRPILMTAGTTVLALLPLALNAGGSSALWSPMALTVIGGMIVATPLTLLMLPVMYSGMAGRSRRRRGDESL